MTEIWWGALLLLALAAVFVLLPGWFLRERQIDTRSSNRDWFLQRRAELETTDETRDSGIGRPGATDTELAEDLLQDARLRMLEEADAGFLFHAPANVIEAFPQYSSTDDYDELRSMIDQAAQAPRE